MDCFMTVLHWLEKDCFMLKSSRGICAIFIIDSSGLY